MFHEDCYSLPCLAYRGAFVWLPTNHPVVDGVFAAGGFLRQSDHLHLLCLVVVRNEVQGFAVDAFLKRIGGLRRRDVVRQASYTLHLGIHRSKNLSIPHLQ